MSTTFSLILLFSLMALSYANVYQQQLPAELQELAAEVAAIEEWEAENRVGRGRRDNDEPFRMCGARLLQHIMDADLCRPDKCEGISKRSAGAEEVFGSRARRGADSKLISTRCCTNMCRPSEVRAICCGH